jgi:hypothetical protein
MSFALINPGRAMTQASKRYIIISESRLQSECSPCGLCDGQGALGWVFL